MKRKQITAMITTMTMVLGITACGAGNVSAEQENKEQTEIESILNISNNDEITWSYDSQSDSWTMSVTCAVANPELPDYQGVSVNVPGAYVKGIDTDGDGTEDVTGKTYSEEVNGQLVIDDSAKNYECKRTDLYCIYSTGYYKYRSSRLQCTGKSKGIFRQCGIWIYQCGMWKPWQTEYGNG